MFIFLLVVVLLCFLCSLFVSSCSDSCLCFGVMCFVSLVLLWVCVLHRVGLLFFVVDSVLFCCLFFWFAFCSAWGLCFALFWAVLIGVFECLFVLFACLFVSLFAFCLFVVLSCVLCCFFVWCCVLLCACSCCILGSFCLFVLLCFFVCLLFCFVFVRRTVKRGTDIHKT